MVGYELEDSESFDSLDVEEDDSELSELIDSDDDESRDDELSERLPILSLLEELSEEELLE